jgi:hypothetical protein
MLLALASNFLILDENWGKTVALEPFLAFSVEEKFIGSMIETELL